MSRHALSTSPDMRALCRRARRAGWAIEKTNGHHLRFVAPTGSVVVTGSTPSDNRAIKNTRADLRRAWPDWEKGAR